MAKDHSLIHISDDAHLTWICLNSVLVKMVRWEMKIKNEAEKISNGKNIFCINKLTQALGFHANAR